MIPVAYQHEPTPPEFDFHGIVRKPGLDWLDEYDIALDGPLPKKAPRHWRKCMDELYRKYDGICAYLSVRKWHSLTVDHYLPVSKRAGLAYEWSNYRLACSEINTYKSNYAAVLDPFDLAHGTFQLDLELGIVKVSPRLSGKMRDDAQATIDRLQLNRYRFRDIRTRHFAEYRRLRDATAPPHQLARQWLREYSPFVYQEADRQGRLAVDSTEPFVKPCGAAWLLRETMWTAPYGRV
ncbi:MAG: hypothetical protein FWD57_13685 [Polyangiaceae bacterium]|nr:hypothetical protein [Polyangiaceae bacterium]